LIVKEKYEHRLYAHCETGVVASLLRHHGLEISEPMIFGLASGLMFAFLPFVKMMGGMPVVAYRIMPKSIIRGVQKQLGIKFEMRSYKDEDRAMRELDEMMREKRIVGLQASLYWLPFIPQEMRVQFNAHNIVAFGKENGDYWVGDIFLEQPSRIQPGDLRNARFAKGVMAPKGFVYYPTYIPDHIDIDSLITKSIRKTTRMMLGAPPPCGVRGIFYLANYLEKLKGKRDEKYIRFLLGHIAQMQEETGSGGGGFRYMYAAFLQESYARLSLQVLEEASRKMMEAGHLWRQFALVCARTFKARESTIDLGHIAGLLRRAGEAERDVHRLLKAV
jgi:hypothetical protein